MESIPLLRTAASAMDAERLVLDAAARNVAAAEAAGPNGTHARFVPVFHLEDDEGETIVVSDGKREETRSHVEILSEMIAVMNASRAYEASASLFDVGKTLAEKTIDLGRL